MSVLRQSDIFVSSHAKRDCCVEPSVPPWASIKSRVGHVLTVAVIIPGLQSEGKSQTVVSAATADVVVV
ncbi:MAG: hypothetical protein QOF79_2897, partial [Actinomycetota bacterium]|nr:hypothetical protein [Actinomycetota bacterium]